MDGFAGYGRGQEGPCSHSPKQTLHFNRSFSSIHSSEGSHCVYHLYWVQCIQAVEFESVCEGYLVLVASCWRRGERWAVTAFHSEGYVELASKVPLTNIWEHFI